jgi:hypothetical protein
MITPLFKFQGMTIHGEYEGKPDLLFGPALNHVLVTNFALAVSPLDFVNKVTYHITDQTNKLSDEDISQLRDWYNANKKAQQVEFV